MVSETVITNIKNFMFKFQECTKKSGDRAKLIAVSKKKEFQLIQLAHELGIKFFGENYPQELRDKNIQKTEKIYILIGILLVDYKKIKLSML